MKRVVVITGAAGGIGRATAASFASSDWSVIGVDRNQETGPVVGRSVLLDVSDARGVESFYAEVREREGQVDALVNAAAIQPCGPLVEMDVDEWDRTMAVNVRGAFLMTRGAVELMQGGGAVVNVSSVHAIATSADIAAYGASKSALLSLTRSLALELASRGIRVNAVLPGAIDTDMLRDGMSRGLTERESVEDRLAVLAGRTPLARVGRPIEVAEAIRFLADDVRSSFVTGQGLVVDGGATARLSTE